MRYPISGTNTVQLSMLTNAAATALGGAGVGEDSATCVNLGSILYAPVAGRTFWLRGFSVQAHSTATAERPAIVLFDGTHGGTATASTVRFSTITATGPNTKQEEFPAPGLKFTTGCVACLVGATGFSATQAFGPGRLTYYGYEEG